MLQRWRPQVATFNPKEFWLLKTPKHYKNLKIAHAAILTAPPLFWFVATLKKVGLENMMAQQAA